MYFVLYQLLFLYCICILYCNQSRRTATRDQLSLRRPTYLLTYLLRAVSALTLLVGRHEEHPACKKLIGDVLVWLSFYLSGVRCTADCLHVVQLMPLYPVVYWGGVYAGIRRIPTSWVFLTSYTHLSDHK